MFGCSLSKDTVNKKNVLMQSWCRTKYMWGPFSDLRRNTSNKGEYITWALTVKDASYDSVCMEYLMAVLSIQN